VRPVGNGSAARTLASCHGYLAVADDGALGVVETPLFPPGSDVPDYLVIRAASRRGERRSLVGVGLVSGVSRTRRLVSLRGTVEELSRLPSSLPAARELR
jgi:hypothetical protein